MCRVLQQDMIEWKDVRESIICSFYVMSGKNKSTHYTNKPDNRQNHATQVQEWQSRPLEAIYPIVYLDGIVFKVRKDSKVINKCIYSVLGIDMDGKKDILGLWISENESASFWLSVCNELKNRGVQDILIACRDNLSGFSKAIETVFPKTEQQLCVIHQIRNSTKYVSYKDLKPLMADLKLVYGAPSLDDAEYRLEEFGKSGTKNTRRL